MLHRQDGEELFSRDGAWLRRWKHSERLGMETLRTFGALIDMPFVRFCEEDAYKRRLRRLVGELIDILVTTDLFIVEAVKFSKVVFDRPFDSLWFIRLHRYW